MIAIHLKTISLHLKGCCSLILLIGTHEPVREFFVSFFPFFRGACNSIKNHAILVLVLQWTENLMHDKSVICSNMNYLEVIDNSREFVTIANQGSGYIQMRENMYSNQITYNFKTKHILTSAIFTTMITAYRTVVCGLDWRQHDSPWVWVCLKGVTV